jgi:predicted small lipoprotein YifL
MKCIRPVIAIVALVAGLAGCGYEPAYPFKGRGYTPPSSSVAAYTSDDGQQRPNDRNHQPAA